jgi:hypothetical protein
MPKVADCTRRFIRLPGEGRRFLGPRTGCVSLAEQTAGCLLNGCHLLGLLLCFRGVTPVAATAAIANQAEHKVERLRHVGVVRMVVGIGKNETSQENLGAALPLSSDV